MCFLASMFRIEQFFQKLNGQLTRPAKLSRQKNCWEWVYYVYCLSACYRYQLGYFRKVIDHVRRCIKSSCIHLSQTRLNCKIVLFIDIIMIYDNCAVHWLDQVAKVWNIPQTRPSKQVKQPSGAEGINFDKILRDCY